MGDDGDGVSAASGEEEEGGEAAVSEEKDVVAPDEPAEPPFDVRQLVVHRARRLGHGEGWGGRGEARRVSRLPHNADAEAEKNPREKGTESSHSAAAAEVKCADRYAETGPEFEEACSADDASDSAEVVSREFHLKRRPLPLFSRLTQRLALSPAGDPLLFSRHVQKPAPRHLTGNLESSG